VKLRACSHLSALDVHVAIWGERFVSHFSVYNRFDNWGVDLKSAIANRNYGSAPES
jgi:hypothetical protein